VDQSADPAWCWKYVGDFKIMIVISSGGGGVKVVEPADFNTVSAFFLP